MGRMKEKAMEDAEHQAEIAWLEFEKQHEINIIKEGMPKTLDECHNKIITLLEQNQTLIDEIAGMNSLKTSMKNHLIGFILGIIASVIVSLIL